MLSIETLSAAKTFTELALVGIANVTVDNVGKSITFQFLADGSEHIIQFDQPSDGLSITAVDVVDGKVVCTLSDGSQVESTNKIETTTTEVIVSDIAIGNVTVGKSYPAGTSFQDIIKDMLTQYIVPEVKLTIDPATTLYDVVTDSVDKIEMFATVTKKTSDIAKVDFIVDGTIKNTVTANVANGGLFEYTYEPATPITANTTLKVTATDTKNGVANATKNIKFVAKSYYGIVDANTGAPTEAVIKTLTGVLKDTKNYVYDGITTDWGKVCYAYPASFGNLTSIKDMINNLNYTTEFTKTTATVDGIEYVCYTQTTASAATDIQLTFA